MKNKEIEELLNEHNYPLSDYYLFNKKDIDLLLSYIEQLENNRDKAIEYIENDLQISILPNNQIINGTEVVKRINKIEKILKGDSDE